MKKKELEEKVEGLEKYVEDLEMKVNTLSNEAYINGIHLKEHPFIPEYLGFIETVSRDTNETGGINARIYTLNGFNISRPVTSKNSSKWVVMSPEGVIHELLMLNMHDAITVLRACGMKVTIDNYYNLNRQAEAKSEENIKKIIGG